MGHRLVLLTGFVLTLILACTGQQGSATVYTVDFGDWTRESNLFTFYFAADSALFESREPLRIEPEYYADTAFYGILLWNEQGDSLADSQVDLVRDIRPDGTEIFYFDRNNNGDLTDDGPPISWQTDTTLESSAFLSLQSDWPPHHPTHARILHDDDPRDEMLNRQAGRPVLTYPLVTFGARRGVWHLDSIRYDIELFSMLNSGRILGMPGEWFIIDVDHNGLFEFLPPDIRVLLTQPQFELEGIRWQAEVDTLGNTLALIEIAALDNEPETVGTPKDQPSNSTRYTGQFVQLPAKPFAGKTLAGDPVSLELPSGQVVVLNFWHTGCIPCRKEIPALNELVCKGRLKSVPPAAQNSPLNEGGQLSFMVCLQLPPF